LDAGSIPAASTKDSSRRACVGFSMDTDVDRIDTPGYLDRVAAKLRPRFPTIQEER